jgi:hypothetical protein
MILSIIKQPLLIQLQTLPFFSKMILKALYRKPRAIIAKSGIVDMDV